MMGQVLQVILPADRRRGDLSDYEEGDENAFEKQQGLES